MAWINADEIAAEIDPSNPSANAYEAARLAAQRRDQWLRQGRSFCYETVFSHESKRNFVQAAKDQGYRVVLVYIHLATIALNQARVQQRVSEGGHPVDPEKVAQRVPRAMRYVGQAGYLVDDFLLFDNSSYDSPFRLIARRCGETIEAFQDPLPIWAVEILFGSK